MKKLEYTLHKKDTIVHALSIIDKGALRIAIVVEEGVVIGTLNDGDIRRGLLRGCSLESLVEDIYNPSPTLCYEHDSKQTIMQKALQNKVYQIPILNEKNELIDIIDFVKLFEKEERKNRVVLMAGGLGTRLKPLTNETPKPLLDVGRKPILETIIRNFEKNNFKDIVISVNYKSDMIKEYFGNGEKFGVSITYIEETQRLGTAGALSLLESVGEEPFFVMNADLLTNVDFSKLLEFHHSSNAKATMCVREYEFQVPYGVIEVEKSSIVSIVEKPIQKFFVNAGIYVLNPEVLELIPKNSYYDMPTLFEKLIQKRDVVSSFPIHEYWLDIGKMIDYNRANEEYFTIFEDAE
jgi:dTDP-glucose pyrophosphorylase